MSAKYNLDEIKAKQSEYNTYINKHIDNVKKIWKHASNVPNLHIDDETFVSIDYLISEHDQSKVNASEYDDYRRYFYPTEWEKENINEVILKNNFDFAWNHHQKTNRHHWQYWILMDDEFKILKMPYIYIIEMLCNWSAMSLKFKDKPSEFYHKNKEKMIFADDTKIFIQRFLPIFDNIVNEINQGI